MTQTAAASAGAHMWSRTDLKPADVDVANLYDGFTVLTLFWLEGLGFCGKGEGGPFVEGGVADRARTASCRWPRAAGSSRPGGCTASATSMRPACSCAARRRSARSPDAKVAAVSAGAGPLASCLLLRTDA